MNPEQTIKSILNMKTLLRSVLTASVVLWSAAGWSAEAGKLPKLVDLGADKCIPCKAMAPILKELKTEYTGRIDVEFIDVWKNPAAGRAHNIKLIPTQIFFDASGKERFRHEGFFSKEDIIAKWKELGIVPTTTVSKPRSEAIPAAEAATNAEAKKEPAK